jgi:uncharacterized membrane protein
MNDYRKQQPNVGDGERLFSLLGAGLAMYVALTRPTPARVPLAAGGSYLLYRGLTGKDPIYEMLNVRRAPGDGDHLFVRRAVTINRPRSEVYTF